ncbi:MAG: hypothetical protein ABIK18_06275, partial [candidate division WOR-3 bacterium]
QYTELGIHNNGSFDELNKVGLIQAADYYWNPEAYKPEEALRKALAIVAGKDSIDLLLQFRDTYCPLIDKYSFLRTGTSPQPISEEVFAPLEKQIEEVGKIIEELNRKCKNTKLVEELSQRYQKLSEAAKSLRDKGLVKKS